jgi:tetratricopeptide (TPR) repeat protein
MDESRGNSVFVAQRYIEVGQPARALETLDRAGVGPDDPDAWRIRGFALYGLERWDDAAEVASDALGAEPEDIGMLYLLSLAEEQRGDLAAAEGAILAALRLEPEDPELLSQYADLTMRAGQLDKAERLLDAAARSDPESPAILRSRVSLAYLRGDDRGAERLSRKLLELDPEDVSGHRMLGALELNAAKPGSAAERFATVLRDQPSDDFSADRARAARLMAKPQYFPVRFFNKVGVGPSWIGAMVVIFGLRGAGLGAAAAVATVVWLVLCVWSWIAGPALDRKLEAQR